MTDHVLMGKMPARITSGTPMTAADSPLVQAQAKARPSALAAVKALRNTCL